MTDTPEVSLFDNSGAKSLIREIRAAFAAVPFPFDFLIGKDEEFIQWLNNVFDEKSKAAQYIPSPWMPRDTMFSLLSDFPEFSPEEAIYVFPRLLIDILERVMQGMDYAVLDARDIIMMLDISSCMSAKQQVMLMNHGLEPWLKSFKAERTDLASYKFAPFQTFSSRQIAVVIQWLQLVQHWVLEGDEDMINSALDFWQAYQTCKSNIKFNS